MHKINNRIGLLISVPLFFSTLAMIYPQLSYAVQYDPICKLDLPMLESSQVVDQDHNYFEEISTGITELGNGRYQVMVSLRKTSSTDEIQLGDSYEVTLVYEEYERELVVD